MHKIIILLILSGIPFMGYSQLMEGDCISGDCKNGVGTFKYKNGDQYIGTYNNGNMHEKGKYISSDFVYEGDFVNNVYEGKGIYTYKNNTKKIRYEGDFKNDMFNGHGILYYGDNSEENGEWKDDIFLGAKIGEYQTKDVLKKGDTIVTFKNKYLLSRQVVSSGKDEDFGFLYPFGKFYFLHKTIEEDNKPVTLSDLQTKQDSTFIEKNVIGFITQESNNQYKFHEIGCDWVTYNKFIQFCDWQICKMENTININNLSYADYERQINEDAELYEIIASQKATDILINVTGDMVDFLWNKKVVDKLKAGSTVSILGQNIATNTSINDYVRLLTTDAVMYQLGLEKFKNIKDCVLQNNAIKVNGGELTLKDFLKDFDRTEQTKRIEKELETETAKFFKQGRDIIDNCIPSDLKFKSKQTYFYYALTMNLPEYGEMLGFMAASIKLAFFNSGYKKEVDAHIANCRNSKQFIEEYKRKYQTLIKENQTNCLGYAKNINQLKSEAFNPSGNQILAQMQAYVFGEKNIPECKVFSIEELKPAKKNIQTEEPISKNDDIIGYYGKNPNSVYPVYKKNDSIIMNNKIYFINLQPYQKSKVKNLTRYFIMYEGNSVRFAKPQEQPHENAKSFIGWINYENDKYEFEPYYDDTKVPGLNYFGSIYIGDNNPENPNGTPNFDIPTQDEIDSSALQHDKCYDALNQKGKWGVISPTTKACDDALSVSCFSTIISNYNKDMLNNPAKFAEILNLSSLSLKTAYNKWQYGDKFRYDVEPLKERALLTGFAFAGVTNMKAFWDAINNYGEREIKKKDNKKQEVLNGTQKITYVERTLIVTKSNGREVYAEQGDYFEGEFNNGEIIQGILYDENGKEKERIIIGRSR
jgi:hypothetical protein